MDPVHQLPAGQCPQCDWCRVITSGTGSQFLLCNKSKTDKRFPKYPSQPVNSCAGFLPKKPRAE